MFEVGSIILVIKVYFWDLNSHPSSRSFEMKSEIKRNATRPHTHVTACLHYRLRNNGSDRDLPRPTSTARPTENTECRSLGISVSSSGGRVSSIVGGTVAVYGARQASRDPLDWPPCFSMPIDVRRRIVTTARWRAGFHIQPNGGSPRWPTQKREIRPL